jgi:large subunit ribosomal protein L5
MTQRLKVFYQDEVVPQLQKEFEYANYHQVPKVEKIVINRGLNGVTQNAKRLETAFQEIRLITGQQPVTTKAKKAIASFQVREKMPIGVSVILRGEKMYAFLDRLVNLALPRIRDFQGLNPKSFDGKGNYNLGFPEQLMFPEVVYEEIETMEGMDIAIVTSAETNTQGKALLQALGMPFRKEENKE